MDDAGLANIRMVSRVATQPRHPPGRKSWLTQGSTLTHAALHTRSLSRPTPESAFRSTEAHSSNSKSGRKRSILGMAVGHFPITDGGNFLRSISKCWAQTSSCCWYVCHNRAAAGRSLPKSSISGYGDSLLPLRRQNGKLYVHWDPPDNSHGTSTYAKYTQTKPVAGSPTTPTS